MYISYYSNLQIAYPDLALKGEENDHKEDSTTAMRYKLHDLFEHILAPAQPPITHRGTCKE
jgi:hypothetical protein